MTLVSRQQEAGGTGPLRLLSDQKARRGYLLVLAATLCWSTSGTFIRLILNDYAFSAWALAFWRDLFTFTLFLASTLALGGGRLRVARRDLVSLAAMGAISIGIFHVLWTMAVAMNPIAVATVLNYTAPVFVVLLAWALWHEKPSRLQTMALVLAFGGCLLVTGAYDLGDARLNWVGLSIALSTGATYGSLSIFGKSALKRYDAFTIMTYAFGFAVLTLIVLNPGAVVQSLSLPAGAFLAVAALSVVSTFTGFSLYTSGLRYLSAGSASITATLEPVIATGLAFALLGEVIAPVQMLGGLLVVGAVALLAAR